MGVNNNNDDELQKEKERDWHESQRFCHANDPYCYLMIIIVNPSVTIESEVSNKKWSIEILPVKLVRKI